MPASSPQKSESAITYSIVIPVYKNEESLPDVIERIEQMQSRLDAPLEAVFVVDGSPDGSLNTLRNLLPKSTFNSQLLAHSRNFGSFPAIKTGFKSARGQYIAAMAADLQEPSELIEDFFAQLKTGEWDVAVGIREGREDPLISRTLSKFYWSTYRKFVQPHMPPGGVDIFATTRAVADKLGALNESNSSLIGLLFWLGYRRIEIPYTRQERTHGKSAWSMRKKISYLLDSVFSFTSMPITAILGLGLTGSILSIVAAFAVFVSWLLGSVPVPGYTALMLVLLFSAGSILFAIGILGTYVWRTYENTKNRPSSILMSTEVFNDESV
ncbi:glycosyltransferase family 2 protein [Lysinibacter sp. HNR]|uniref:glycosyltransferase family 2 protein n=1 Tax=Lysinibacter sp. HNR TaxID=3031408 RepID=UPI00243596A0|nr:glycosyltransferase family 2 protein [Lysinibacter sp. HNR]WGD38064.1 glycosyltransferase family 2 protein [Lysinibacter sp. HNR]